MTDERDQATTEPESWDGYFSKMQWDQPPMMMGVYEDLQGRRIRWVPGHHYGSVYRTADGEEVCITEVVRPGHKPGSAWPDLVPVGPVVAHVRPAKPADLTTLRHGPKVSPCA
jgi:hypothetical protein